MQWKGKIFGSVLGFMMGGPVGAVLGSVIGHQLDNHSPETVNLEDTLDFEQKQQLQSAFFTATFSVMGHLAKADGAVCEAEIQLATRVMNEMQLAEPIRQQAIKLFQEGKSPHFLLETTLAQFRKDCGRHKQFLYMFLEIQLQTAFADGEINLQEETVLLFICEQLGIFKFEYQALKLQFQARQRFYQQQQQGSFRHQSRSQLNDAYAILGVKPSASDSEVKLAYKKLMNQHHPDKLMARGLPEQMLVLAKEKTQQISKAYEMIKYARKS
jgi:DnaJ like chaperone protein